MNELQTTFIRNLKKARSAAGLSQAALAEKCGLSAYYVTEIETGRRFHSVGSIQRLCDALDLRPYRLFLGERDSLDFTGTERNGLYLEQLKQGVDAVFERFRRNWPFRATRERSLP